MNEYESIKRFVIFDVRDEVSWLLNLKEVLDCKSTIVLHVGDAIQSIKYKRSWKSSLLLLNHWMMILPFMTWIWIRGKYHDLRMDVLEGFGD